MKDKDNGIEDLLEVMEPSPTGGGDFETFEVEADPEEGPERRSLVRLVRRLVISADALLSAEEAIQHVGGRAAVVRAWLRHTVIPLGHPSGRRVYRWGDVVEAMRRAS